MPESIRVLVVDDDPDVRDLTGTFLERVRDDISVTTADGGPAALDVLADAADRVDCVVSDYDMPGMDGLAFLRAVREDHERLPFILFTGKGSEEIASDAIAAGVTDYLQKSQGAEQYEVLANRVVNAVERRRAEARARNLDRINRVIRRVQRGLVAAGTRGEIEALVCEEFAAADPYEFAWIGVPGDAGALEPRVTAGAAAKHLQAAIESTDAATRRRGPGAVAARTGDPQAVQDVQSDPVFAPWRDDIGRADLHSLGAVPLSYGDADYGVLLVYAGRPRAFDDDEMAVLAELGDTIARAIDAAETSRALDFVNEVVEGVSSGVAAYDASGAFVYVNPAFADLLGYESADLLGEKLWTVVDALDPVDFASYWASFDPGETRTVESRHVRADGTTVPVEATTTAVDIAGERYHVGTITDISERVARRRELETYVRRFDAVFDDPAAFIALLEPDGTVVRVNETALSFADADPADVEGEFFWETPWWSFDDAVQADLRDRVAAAARGEFVRFEVENRGANDESVTLDTIVRPVRDDGDVVALIAEGRNVTDRKHLERELRRSKHALQELYAASSAPGTTFEERLDAVLATGCDHLDLPFAALTTESGDGTFTVVGCRGSDRVERGTDVPVSDAYRSAAGVDGVLGVPDVATADREFEIAAGLGLRALLAGDVEVDGERAGMLWFAGRDPRPDGFSEFERTYVELLARWAGYELEQRRANARLERQNDRLDRFASVVTHDLRGPLTTAHGWLDLARDAHPDDDELARVADALDRMDELVSDVRAMTRGGRDVADPAPVSLADVGEAAWSTCHTGDASLAVEDPGVVLADESRVRQLLENLFRNGVEHAGPAASVELGGTPDGFYVADDGPGVPPAERDEVFDHGYSTAAEGTGFGLSIVSEVARAHGWRVSVTESEAGGARFEVSGVDRPED